MQKYNQGQLQQHTYKIKGTHKEQEGAGGKYRMNYRKREEKNFKLLCNVMAHGRGNVPGK
jgi:hypothetical protein